MGFALREPIRPRPINVNDLIVNTLELPWHSGGRITGDIRLHKELWPVRVDPDQLATVLLNLVFNASDALTEGENLIVETTNSSFGDGDTVENADAPKGDFVGIFVGNAGHQMPPEVGKTAFDPFLGAKQSGKGAGLMLSLVHAFATRSSGHCIIEGEPDRSTTIRLYLPRHRSDQEMKPEVAEATTRNTSPIWVAPTIRQDPVGP
jgi:signal transduction histidine kinase